jgi:hypothetical protein
MGREVPPLSEMSDRLRTRIHAATLLDAHIYNYANETMNKAIAQEVLLYLMQSKE